MSGMRRRNSCSRRRPSSLPAAALVSRKAPSRRTSRREAFARHCVVECLLQPPLRPLAAVPPGHGVEAPPEDPQRCAADGLQGRPVGMAQHAGGVEQTRESRGPQPVEHYEQRVFAARRRGSGCPAFQRGIAVRHTKETVALGMPAVCWAACASSVISCAPGRPDQIQCRKGAPCAPHHRPAAPVCVWHARAPRPSAGRRSVGCGAGTRHAARTSAPEPG